MFLFLYFLKIENSANDLNTIRSDLVLFFGGFFGTNFLWVVLCIFVRRHTVPVFLGDISIEQWVQVLSA